MDLVVANLNPAIKEQSWAIANPLHPDGYNQCDHEHRVPAIGRTAVRPYGIMGDRHQSQD